MILLAIKGYGKNGNKSNEKVKELNLILIVLIGIVLAQWIKWKIISLALLYYMNKKQYEWPNDDEMKSCTDFVTKNMAKDLFGSKTKGGL